MFAFVFRSVNYAVVSPPKYIPLLHVGSGPVRARRLPRPDRRQLFPNITSYSEPKFRIITVEEAIKAANGQKPCYTQTNGNGNNSHGTHNGNGRNGNHRGSGIPPGYGIALGGQVVPIEQLPELNRNFRENTRMR